MTHHPLLLFHELRAVLHSPLGRYRRRDARRLDHHFYHLASGAGRPGGGGPGRPRARRAGAGLPPAVWPRQARARTVLDLHDRLIARRPRPQYPHAPPGRPGLERVLPGHLRVVIVCAAHLARDRHPDRYLVVAISQSPARPPGAHILARRRLAAHLLARAAAHRALL